MYSPTSTPKSSPPPQKKYNCIMVCLYRAYDKFMSIFRCKKTSPSISVIINNPSFYNDKSNDNNQNIIKVIHWNDTKVFIPPIQYGYVIKVYDGDTITIAVEFPFEPKVFYRFSVRLLGIDTPETHDKTEDSILIAQYAKNEMTKMVMNKIVLLKNISFEKYGRLLADVYIENIHINEHMIQKRLAVPYNGGKKQIPVSWVKYNTTGMMN